VRSMKGLENAHILRPGYAIEYDYFHPPHLHAALAKDPVLRRGILDGSVEVITDVYRTPHPYMSSVIHPSAIPVPLDRTYATTLQSIVRQHPDYTE